jgi:DNA sulfur modification protein DndC
MKSKQIGLFNDARLTQSEAIEMTASILGDYFRQYNHVAIAFSGGKDSTATLTTVIHLIETGKIPRPRSLSAIYADTRLELPPLHIAAMATLAEVERHGFSTQVAMAPLDKRMLVYILGRGVPPPNNSTLRYCTAQIKVNPMMATLSALRESLPDGERLLMLTGVRLGESAVRDRRIALSCSKNGAECGQGWFQHSSYDRTDTLAPILHWRVCHVWDWLIEGEILHGFPTMMVAQAYGGDEAIEAEARTGCIGCPLTQKETALDAILKMPHWSYLAPLKQLKPIYERMREFQYRLQKDGSERRRDGSLVKNPGRKGPLKLEARLMFLEEILSIQNEINEVAIATSRPTYFLINEEEEARIRELIELRTFPDGWSGTESGGEILLPEVYSSGYVQPLLFG